MKDNGKQILENLNQIRGLLISTLNLLDEGNENGKQFDYVNSPKLSNSLGL